MNSSGNLTCRSKPCHVVAMPSPGRGHINPIMNFCKSLLATTTAANEEGSENNMPIPILITFVVTEEWLRLIGSDPNKPDNIRFAVIPNVVPSELDRASNMQAFVEAVMTKMEAPFEQILDELDFPASIILADTYLFWAVRVGNHRNIPVASFWPMSATVLTINNSTGLLEKMGDLPFEVGDKGDKRIDYIPGVSSICLRDLPTVLHGKDKKMFSNVKEEAFSWESWLPKVQYLLLNSTYELEPAVIDCLKEKFEYPVYPVRSTTSPLEVREISPEYYNYMDWLDSKPEGSVLYISFGSIFSVSSDQKDEIVAGLRDSGVSFLWVARGEALHLKDACGDRGIVVQWCDQARVLSHASVAGFWSHCGWNSVQEGVYAGVPFLTFPLIVDQVPNSKQVVEDWKIGWRINTAGPENLVKKEEIARIVKSFMDSEMDEVKEMRRRAKEMQSKVCHHGALANIFLPMFRDRSISQGGSKKLLRPCSYSFICHY